MARTQAKRPHTRNKALPSGWDGAGAIVHPPSGSKQINKSLLAPSLPRSRLLAASHFVWLTKWINRAGVGIANSTCCKNCKRWLEEVRGTNRVGKKGKGSRGERLVTVSTVLLTPSFRLACVRVCVRRPHWRSAPESESQVSSQHQSAAEHTTHTSLNRLVSARLSSFNDGYHSAS